MPTQRITSSAKILTSNRPATTRFQSAETIRGSSNQTARRETPQGGTLSSTTRDVLPSGAVGVASEFLAFANTLNTATIVFWTAIGFYVFQFALWTLGIAVLALGSVPVVGGVVPGKEFYMATWALIAFIGISSMAYTAFMFFIRNIPCFDGWKGLIFILCLAGYLTVFINLIPWFAVWIGAIVWIEKIKSNEVFTGGE